jgi:hypothetical protein
MNQSKVSGHGGTGGLGVWGIKRRIFKKGTPKTGGGLGVWGVRRRIFKKGTQKTGKRGNKAQDF